MPQINRRATRAVIHLDHIDHNLNCIKKLTGGRSKICVAVKADAYGHGAVEVAKRALQWGVDFLAIATVNEAVILREAGINAPILLFSLPLDAEIPDLVQYGLTPFVGDKSYAEKLNTEAASQKRSIKVHIKVDTGMGRIGVTPHKATELAGFIGTREYLIQEGVCTHFPVSDSPEEDDIRFTKNQISLFQKTVDAIRAIGLDPGIVHAANSGAIIAYSEAHFDMVRAGICLYGYYPDPRMKKPAAFKPVMELVSRVAFLKRVQKGTSVSYGRTWSAPRDSWIATIPVGYGDGYNRLLSGRGRVMINGQSYPIVGRICMDQFMVDLGPVTDVVLFDPVILFGPDDGAMTATDIAGICNSIPYELTCNINKRVPRDYKERTKSL
ncbi:MAG: alanine racemase [Spirochaetaceae bacterium 4572_59]|nr:MAG: alanine racemase [Spirochaetaceae bacterium 4572_59]